MNGDPSAAARAVLERLRSASPQECADGVDALVRAGGEGVAALAALLGDPGAPCRADAMYALSRLGGRGAEEVFRRGLDDADERVRAYAAVGLARTGAAGGLDALLRTLDTAADPLHADRTPAVDALAELGLAAVPALLDQMEGAGDETTRLHAQTALEEIVNRRHGFRPGRGFPDPGSEAGAREAWEARGGYRFDAPPAERAASVAKWRAWLARQEEA